MEHSAGLRLFSSAVLAASVGVAHGETLAVVNGGVAAELAGSWVVEGQTGEVIPDPDQGRAAPGALRLQSSEGPAAATAVQTLPVRAGQAVKLSAWARAEGVTGETYAALELLENGAPLQTPAPERKVRGPLPGWVALWHVLDVPADSPATHLRIVLRTDGPGTVWFDDVKLRSLPANKPVLDGAPDPPPWGVIQARGGDLVGESGRRVRFWGVNCVAELGRDRRQITHLVRRIKAVQNDARGHAVMRRDGRPELEITSYGVCSGEKQVVSTIAGEYAEYAALRANALRADGRPHGHARKGARDPRNGSEERLVCVPMAGLESGKGRRYRARAVDDSGSTSH